MADHEKKGGSGGTVGVGYVSIMLIFTVICLTIFAVLSFQAVYSSDKMSARSDGFTQQYYDADIAAKKKLAVLDGLAAEVVGGFDFQESFTEAASAVEGVTARSVPGGVEVEYSIEMNGRQSLAVSVVFFSAPAGDRFDITGWSCTENNAIEDSHPSVWDGGDLVGDH